jgi:anti-sigma B factor antagonist
MNSTVAEIKDGPFGLTVTSIGSTRTVTTNGELDLATVKTLADVLDEIYGEGAETIVIDLGGLEFIDSTGLALLVLSHKRFNLDGGRRLRLLPAEADGVRRVFSLTGLDEGLPFSKELNLDVPDRMELEAT